MIVLDTKNINEILKSGGIITYPTDTVWGVGCLPDNEKAVKKIYEIKKREAQKPLILMSSDIKYLLPFVKMNKTAERLIEKHFPGALTLVMNKTNLVGDYLTSNMPTVGIRVPNHPVFMKICDEIEGHVLATTSANLSHEPAALTYSEACGYMSGKSDIIVEDFGYSAKGLASTVAGVFGDEIKVFRQGEIQL